MSSSEVFAHVKDSDVVLLLAFIGGYYDTTGYLKLLGVFTSSITGNLVVACSSVTSNKGVLCRSLVCVAFFLAGGIGASITVHVRLVNKFNTRKTSIVLYSVVWIVMLIVWIVGSRKDDSIRHAENLNDGNVILLGTLMGAAMGFHNIAAKESITNCPPTTVMTSTLVNVASNGSQLIGYYFAIKILFMKKYTTINNDNTDANETNNPIEKLVSSYQDKFNDFKSKFIVTVKPLICFIIGGIVGAVITDYASFHSTSIPWFIVTFIIFEIIVKEYGFNSNNKEKSADNKPELAKAIELTAMPIEPSKNVKDVEDIYDFRNINDNKTIADV